MRQSFPVGGSDAGRRGCDQRWRFRLSGYRSVVVGRGQVAARAGQSPRQHARARWGTPAEPPSFEASKGGGLAGRPASRAWRLARSRSELMCDIAEISRVMTRSSSSLCRRGHRRRRI